MGNGLRGYFECEAESMMPARTWLTKRFNDGFPSYSGRRVEFSVFEKNPYGHEQWMLIEKLKTSGGNAPKTDYWTGEIIAEPTETDKSEDA